MTPKRATLSRSYDRLQENLGHSRWFEQVKQLRAEPNRYRLLDAAQLVKHALGLLRRFGTREVWLVYLYWEPRNERGWPECRQHRKEIDDFAAKVAQSTARLMPMSYRELWDEWERQGQLTHLKYLRDRYDRDV